MKVGILTFHRSLNCGAALQAWSLQTYLRSQGYDAAVVNYGNIGCPSRWRMRTDSFRCFLRSVYCSVRTCVESVGLERYRRHLYRRFLQDCIQIGKPVGRQEIVRGGYTHLITGSDQVWNPVLNEGDSQYFLTDIAEGVKRISYAPSFGTEAFDPAIERKMAQWLARFDAVSVREPKGADLVRRLIGREASVVCDPTLLLSQDDFAHLERKPAFGLPERYLAAYTVCGHPWAESAAVSFGRQYGLPVVHLLGGQVARWRWPSSVRRVSALGPAEFLWFVHHAAGVVTNSFHGTVFSLLYHRPVVVALNGKASDERMTNLLSGTGLSSRLAGNPDAASGLDLLADCDWRKVDEAVRGKRLTGVSFLRCLEVGGHAANYGGM